MNAEPWRRTGDTVLLDVRLTPKAARDAVTGLFTEQAGAAAGRRVAVSVRALPDKGAANAALNLTVARWLSLPKSFVTLAAGGKSRLKTLALSGDPDELATQLRQAVAALTNGDET